MIARQFLAPIVLATALQAFSTTNLQYLYGQFEGPTFLDTKSGYKHTLTLEHYRTFEYGDLFAFLDYTYAPDGLKYNDQDDLYGEFSPRLSLDRISGVPLAIGPIKEWYTAFQYNRGESYRAWLYGIGVDVAVPGFSVFGINLYRKIQTVGDDTYQLSANYLLPLGERWHFEGFTDWTTRDLLSQNQLLLNIAPELGIRNGALEIGTEWHYYREHTHRTGNDVFQAMIKYRW